MPNRKNVYGISQFKQSRNYCSLRFCIHKPLDEKELHTILKPLKKIITIEEEKGL
jgi:hypothetical protein